MNQAAEENNHIIEWEAALIGHVLCNESLASQLLDITPEHFSHELHFEIWKAVMALRDLGKPITPFTICGLMPASDLLEKVGGLGKYSAYAIQQSLLYSWPLELEKAIINQFKGENFKVICSGGNVREIADAAAQMLLDETPECFFDNVQVTEKIIEEMKGGVTAISSGLAKLDEAMGGGFYPKKSYGFAARKKMGKTMLGATISHNLNMNGVPHLFICGEMSPEEVQQRIICRIMGYKPSVMRGKNPEAAFKIAEKLRLMPRNVTYRNAPGLTFDELKIIVDRAVDLKGIKGFILDYWQLVGGKEKNRSSSEHLDEVAQWVADYCRKNDLFSIVFAQINQEGNTRGGEGLRLACDQVYELRAPENDPSRSGRYLEMRDTRYTQWMNVGSEKSPALELVEDGLYFEQIEQVKSQSALAL